MQRIFITAVFSLACLLCACAESNEKSASRSYVKAAQKVSAAQAAFDSADYTAALELCNQARADVEKIIIDYPETPVALKVVTDGSTRIGPCTYAELNSVVIPKLKLFTDEKIYPLDAVWAIAVSQEKRDDAIRHLAEKILASKSYDSKKRDMILACAREISDATSKSVLLKRLNPPDSKPSAKGDGSEPEKAKAIAPKLKIANEKMFLTQARSDAALVSYDMQAIENLRQKAEQAKGASDALKADFSKILQSARSDILKISVADLREKAMATLALAFSNLGDESNAISIAQTLKTPEIFANVFNSIAKQASSGKNYTLAIALSARLPEGDTKNSFLVELSGGVASQGLGAEAAGIASTIKDVSARNRALAHVAAISLANGDKKNFELAVSKIDLNSQDYSWLKPFKFEELKVGKESKSNPSRDIALLASALIENGADKKLCETVNNKALELCKAIGKEDSNMFSSTLDIVARNMASVGGVDSALKFIILNIDRSDPSVSFGTICDIAKQCAAKDKALAASAFRVAADLCPSLPGSAKYRYVIDLAWTLQNSGLDRSESVKILKPFLPEML